MKFLLDMNAPRELGLRLQALGHECRHTGDCRMHQAHDWEIVEEARRNNEIIITNDLDFGRLLYFSEYPTNSVVIYRMRNNHIDYLYERFINAFNHIEKPLRQGAIVILEDSAIRIRPISKQQES